MKLMLMFSVLLLGINGGLLRGQPGMDGGEGTCGNPYVIKDSVFSVQLKVNDAGKIWFSFISRRSRMLIDIKDADGHPCNYLIFRYTGREFCNEVKSKSLIPERNRVCNKDIAYDAATTLSFENINGGLCKCDYCCLSQAYFYTIPGDTYIIVVYNPSNSVSINLGAAPEKVVYALVPGEQKQDIGKKEPRTFSGDTKVENLQVGQSLTLENIYFEGGTASFLPISYDALEGLLDFLQKNPSVKIEIQGHVNGPNQPPDINYSNNLGYRRARAVYDYLVNRKTDKERLSCKGFGNTQMVYPNAVIEPEMAKNRRVEIVIVSK